MRGHNVAVEFLGASSARPRIMTEKGAPRAADSYARRVVYGDLWPGIKVIFAFNPAGEAEIT